MAIPEKRRAEIIALLPEGVLRNAKIAEKVGGV
jgi:hypothetical protein